MGVVCILVFWVERGDVNSGVKLLVEVMVYIFLVLVLGFIVNRVGF